MVTSKFCSSKALLFSLNGNEDYEYNLTILMIFGALTIVKEKFGLTKPLIFCDCNFIRACVIDDVSFIVAV